MATVTTGMTGDRESVVLKTNHARYEITEHLTVEAAKKLGVQLMAAAGRVERADARPEWP